MLGWYLNWCDSLPPDLGLLAFLYGMTALALIPCLILLAIERIARRIG